jgi:hypothetical protein
MPHFSYPITREGCTLNVLICLRSNDVQTLVAAGQPISPPLSARALIDNGSDRTAVAVRLLQQLGIPPAGPVETYTAGGKVTVETYDLSLSIPNPSGALTPMLTYGELTVTEFQHAPPQIDLLIGMDILRQCLFVMDGPGDRFTLAF